MLYSPLVWRGVDKIMGQLCLNWSLSTRSSLIHFGGIAVAPLDCSSPGKRRREQSRRSNSDAGKVEQI